MNVDSFKRRNLYCRPKRDCGKDLDRETMESVIQESREVAGIKRAVKLDEVFDFRLVQRANDELRSWRP